MRVPGHLRNCCFGDNSTLLKPNTLSLMVRPRWSMRIMKRSVRSVPPAAAVIGSNGWRDATLRSILRAEDLVRQTLADKLDPSTRYRNRSVGTVSSGIKQLTAEPEHNDGGLETKFRPKSAGTALTSGMLCGPFPPPALREQSAAVSISLAGEYMRGVREVEGHLRRQAGRVTQEGTRVKHQREHLEKLLCSIRKALLVNQRSSDFRTFRPATTETTRDGADYLLLHERRGLNVLKHELENMLRKTLTQQQDLAESSKQLLDCAFERSRVTELLPQHGSLSAGIKTSPSPFSLKPDPAGPFTPECKQALDSSVAVLRESQHHRENVTQVMNDVIRKQTALDQSASEALEKKISETINLEQHLTLSSAVTRQAIFRKQRQFQCAGYSLGRAMGPVSSADLFCRERLSRPMTQVYGRHSSVGLPESDLLTQGSTMLRKHLESSGKEIAELQMAHQHLENDVHGKRAAVRVDSAIVRLRRRSAHPQIIRPATS